MIGILLAAGRGTRMKSDNPKVLFPICGEPMASAPLRALGDSCDHVIVVVGYQASVVQDELTKVFVREFGSSLAQSKLHFVVQSQQLGTGDAVRVAIKKAQELKMGEASTVVVLNGDLPLVRSALVKKMATELEQRKLQSLCLSSLVVDPAGLGRIVRDPRGVLEKICEESDAISGEKSIKEVNSGVYAFDYNYLKNSLETLTTENQQKEYYLTDLLGIKKDSKRLTDALMITGEEVEDLVGANSTWELSRADAIAQARWKRALCESFGVLFLAADSCYVERTVKFSGSATIGPGTYLRGVSQIGKSVVIEGSSLIANSELQENAVIKWGSVVCESFVGARSVVGPMAHLRPQSELREDVKVGNFVEIKKTKMAKGSKVSHLSYLGDAEVGENSNIGCGAITCNYDGFQKHQTIIGRDVFVGSDSQLVAPVTIGDGAYVATGTTVTQNVEPHALVIGRVRAEVKKDYAKKINEKKKATKK